MQVLRIEAENIARLANVKAPTPKLGEALVAIRYVGLCGSDLNTFRGLNPLVELPRIPGHEISGIVEAVGPNTTGNIKPGQRVTIVPYTHCGQCSACLKGRFNACRYNKTLGVQQDGGLAEKIVVPIEKLIVNDTLDSRHLALVEPLSVGFHAVDRGSVTKEDTVVVIGCGMIGIGAVIGAVARGAKVIAIDVQASKAKFAKRLGASASIAAQSEDVAQRIDELTGGHGADVVIEAVGLPITFIQAIDFAGYAGRVVYVGYSKAPVAYETRFFNLKELDILGSRNATRADFEAVIAYLEQMKDEADALITRTFAFSDAEQALPFWVEHPDSLKVMIEVSS